jgi:hypothetical protein
LIIPTDIFLITLNVHESFSSEEKYRMPIMKIDILIIIFIAKKDPQPHRQASHHKRDWSHIIDI